MGKTIEGRIATLEEGNSDDRILLLLVEGDAPTAEQQSLVDAAKRAGKLVLLMSRADERL